MRTERFDATTQSPLLRDEARKSFSTGLALTDPMYITWLEEQLFNARQLIAQAQRTETAR